MIRPRLLLRLWRINRVLVKHGLDEIILQAHLFRPFRILLYIAPWNWVPRKRKPRAVRIREALEDLGPIFVKFGQMLSTRRDLLPPDIAGELAHLQDRVPPFPSAEARAEIEAAYGQPVTELFAHFEADPLASASIAQVHAAELADGRQVVVKVLRPGVEKRIRADLELMYVIAGLASRYWRDGKRLRPIEVVGEYEKTIIDELDLMREAANAAQLRRNFTGSDLLYVPEVYWPYARRNVIVLERIHGIPVSNLEALRGAGINMQALAERGVEIFFTQVFDHNFFHADMHPGNIFVSRDTPDTPRYLAVDFGIVGTLSPEDRNYLAANFVAFFNRDYRKVAELHVESEWVPPDTRVDEFESAIRTVCEPIFNRPLKDISFGQLLLRLFQTARRFNMEVQPQLVLLQKTLLNIEGLGRDLYPDLDLWQTAKPFLENWMRRELGLGKWLREAREQAPDNIRALLEMPQLMRSVLEKMQSNEMHVRWESDQLERLENTLRRNRRHMYLGGAGAGLLVAGGLLVGLGASPVWLGHAALIAGAGILAAGFLATLGGSE